MKSIFPAAIDADLLKLVHLSNDFHMVDGVKPLAVGDVCKAETRVISVINVRRKNHQGQCVIEVATAFNAPLTNVSYSKIPGDFNPIHINPLLLRLHFAAGYYHPWSVVERCCPPICQDGGRKGPPRWCHRVCFFFRYLCTSSI